MDILVIGGGGTIGSTVAYTLSLVNPSTDIVLTDTRSDAVEGHEIDLRHSTRHVAHSIGQPDFDTEGPGSVHTAELSPEVVSSVDCIVMAASARRPEGGDERGGRLTFLKQNTSIADDIAAELRDGEPTPTVVVSNPVDRITHRLWERTGWPRGYFLGYSLSETARLADELARITAVSADQVYCPILGEHGEHIVPVFSRATVGGRPLDISSKERSEIVDYVRNVPYDVLKLRGATDSSRWVTGRGIVAIIERLRDGTAEEPVCLSTPLEGEYGFENVSLSVPVYLGKTGIDEIVEWSLSPDERDQLERAYTSIKESRIREKNPD